MLNWLYAIVAQSILGIHAAFAPVFGRDSGWAWGLSIVLLVVAMRLLLFPLFVKQIKTQRAMQVIQPKIKELQARHKGDRQTLNEELMKLYKEHNANPLTGCLPLLAQIPLFLALFRVLEKFQPNNGVFSSHFGISKELVESAAKAKIFGAPIASKFNASPDLLHQLHGSVGVVRTVTIVMILLMTASTFFTQRQMMLRNGATDNPMAQQQKILLYVFPLFFAVFGINFPVGVLLYWLTTNIWTFGQQYFVLKRMNLAPVAAGGAAGRPATRPAPPSPPAPSKPATDGTGGTDTGSPSAPGARPGTPPRRPPGKGKSRNRRGGRR